MVKAYWLHVHRLAFAEAAKTFGLNSRARVLIGAVAIVAALLCLAFWGSADASKDEAIVRLAIASTLVGLFPFFYLWNLVKIPVAMNREKIPHELCDFGPLWWETELIDFGANYGGQQRTTRMFVPVIFKKDAIATTIRITVFRPKQKHDRTAPVYIYGSK